MMCFQSRRFGGLFVAVFIVLAAPFAAQAATNVWAPTSSLTHRRYMHAATLLPSGKVLIAGGAGVVDIPANIELYDPAKSAWSAAGSLISGRYDATATLLQSGRVLFAGGAGSIGPLASAELYDPASSASSPVGSLATPRFDHTATLLPSGKVLVVGGLNNSAVLGSAELYDPANNMWSAAGDLATVRYGHTATLLRSGQVLVAGGISGNCNCFLASAELYDPPTNAWSAAASLATAHYMHTATLLRSGQVLVASGFDSSGSLGATAELYDPASNSWNLAGSLTTPRQLAAATLLPSGQVLVSGGVGNYIVSTAELYDPSSNAWSAGGSFVVAARYSHTATLLPSGLVLAAGGYGNEDGASFGALFSAELYIPDATISIHVSSPTVPAVSAMAATPSSPVLTVTVTAPTPDLTSLSLTDLTGTVLPLDGSYGSLSSLPALTPNGDGTYSATATYTPPHTPPVDAKTLVGITVTQGSLSASHNITLGGPPVLLFHGLWDDAGDLGDLRSQALETSALDAIPINYGAGAPCAAGNLSSTDYASAATLSCVQIQIKSAAARLRALGYSFDSFDAIGHSMGSLVASYYQGTRAGPDPGLPQIAHLASIGTPWNGTPLATVLWAHKDDGIQIPDFATVGSPIWFLIEAQNLFDIVKVKDAFAIPLVGRPIGSAIQALDPTDPVGSNELMQARQYASPILAGEVAGQAPVLSSIEVVEDTILNLVVAPNDAPQFISTTLSIAGLLGDPQQHDVVVPLASQEGVLSQIAVVPATHVGWDMFFGAKAKTGGVLSELHSPVVLGDALCALGHTTQCNLPAPSLLSSNALTTSDELSDLANISLTGTQLSADAITIAAAQPIMPFSSFTASVTGTATCTPQTTFVVDSFGTVQESQSSAPSFTLPTGADSTAKSNWLIICSTGDFVLSSQAFAVNTPTQLSIQAAPDATIIQPGDTVIVRVTAQYAEGSMDVTGDSGTTFSALGPQTYLGGGAYQVDRYGMIFVTVTYGGQTAMVVIRVGADELFESGFE